jgi:hypothetical protein
VLRQVMVAIGLIGGTNAAAEAAAAADPGMHMLFAAAAVLLLLLLLLSLLSHILSSTCTQAPIQPYVAEAHTALHIRTTFFLHCQLLLQQQSPPHCRLCVTAAAVRCRYCCHL